MTGVSNRAPRRVAVTVCMVLAAAVLNATQASPASAAGDPALDRLIIPAPESGWTPFSSAMDAQAAQEVSGGGVDRIATRGWTSPDQTEVVTVHVMQWPSDVDPTRALRTFIPALCGYSPVTSSIPGIAGSLRATCTPSTIYAGDSMTIAAAHKGPVMEAVVFVGTQHPSNSALAGIATKQYAALPAPPLDGAKIGIGIAIILIALLAAFTALQGLRRRARSARTDAGSTTAVGHPPAYDRSHAPDRQLREAWKPESEPVLPRFNPRG